MTFFSHFFLFAISNHSVWISFHDLILFSFSITTPYLLLCVAKLLSPIFQCCCLRATSQSCSSWYIFPRFLSQPLWWLNYYCKYTAKLKPLSHSLVCSMGFLEGSEKVLSLFIGGNLSSHWNKKKSKWYNKLSGITVTYATLLLIINWKEPKIVELNHC